MHSPLYYYMIIALYLVSLNAIIQAHSYSTSSFRPSCPEYERLALSQFKNSFHIDCHQASEYSDPNIIPYAKVKSWVGRNADCCSWDGVECDRETGHVIGLNLKASCLYGTFPRNSTIFDLPYLRKLILSYNNFNYSGIPFELGRLSELRVLRLFTSRFSGEIPVTISKLSKLSVLEIGEDLGGTQLLEIQNRRFEKLVRNLTHLKDLTFKEVDMLSSTVPVILQNLTTLKQISLVDCNLRGELPPAVFRLPMLETLDLSFNDDIDGSLPEFEWHHHSPLKNISLISTSLSGELPHSIGKLAELEVLILSACQLSGSIPSSVGNLTKLSKLYLSDNDFTGVVPPSISNLRNLEKLFLSNLNVMLPGKVLISNLANLHKLKSISLSGLKLGGKIPTFLSNVTMLREVYLTNTQVVGRLPQWIGNLTQLEILELDGNQLEGPIPEWLFSRLKNLHGLSLSYNNLFGNFDLFSGLQNLEYLILSGTRLTFSHVPQQNYSSLPNLKLLWLESCSLTEFPVFLRDQHELQHLRLGQNRIKGSIPQWFVDVTKENLLRFEVFNNHLTGFEQPVTAVLPWTRLEVFDIGGNNFHGHLPVPPVSIKSYDVSNNLFTGVIPEQICMTTSPIKLDFSNNNLSRQLIPRCIADNLADSLQLLNLRGNNFHGIIPGSFSTYCNLKMINLSENQLEGELPRSLANCKMLEVLDIGKNRINDTFPSWLASLPKLQVFVQSHNNFHGRILGTRFCCLRIIDLSHNFYTGELPSGMMAVKGEQQSDSYNTKISFIMQLGAAKDVFLEKSEYSMTITSKGSERLYSKILEVFKVIDFSSNNFTGEIPDNVIGKLRGLQALNLSNNNLEGKIPASLAYMKDLESLDLSRNMLSGVIPTDMPKLTSLEVFDVSYNRLEGYIPQGNQFDTFLSGSYLGNSRLCGRPLPNECTSAPLPVIGANEASLRSYEGSRWIDWVVRSCGCVSGFIIGTVIGKVYVTDKYHEWFTKTFKRKEKKAARQCGYIL